MRVDVHGYDKGFREQDEPIPRSLGEITLVVAEANELRRLASFLVFAADELSAMGDAFDHVHLRDWDREWSETDADLVVVRTR